MSRKVLAGHVRRGSSSALAALSGAWVHQVLLRQHVGWVDVGIGAGLAALWLLGRRQK